MCPFPHPVICPLPPPLHHTPIPSNGPSLILYCEQLHSAEPWPKIPTGLTFRMTLCLILLGLQVLGYPTLWHFSPFITNPLKTLKSKDQVCLSWGLMTERKKMKEVVGGGAGRFGHSEESDRAATSLPVRLFELHNFEQMPFFPLRV